MEGEEEDVSCYWMTLRKWEDTESLKEKHCIALCGELALVVRQTTEWMKELIN
jgi:hypothetical protein